MKCINSDFKLKHFLKNVSPKTNNTDFEDISSTVTTTVHNYIDYNENYSSTTVKTSEDNTEDANNFIKNITENVQSYNGNIIKLENNYKENHFFPESFENNYNEEETSDDFFPKEPFEEILIETADSSKRKSNTKRRRKRNVKNSETKKDYHLENNKENNNEICKLCRIILNVDEEIHKKLCHGNDEHLCSVCKKEFTELEKLRSHVEIHKYVIFIVRLL